MTASTPTAFDLLHPYIQRFIWSQSWQKLRAVQEMAIPPILKADHDVIIAAATASGKTEAAFLPALSYLLQSKPGGLVVYVSPLKALINDQFGRMSLLCQHLDLPVWPWHGDISASRKSRFLTERRGVLLITPESLEAFLCNRGTSIAFSFAHTVYVIVDELHAFIGAERGKQLQSLLHRVEHAIGRTVPRLGLSATIGDMRLAAEFLRPGKGGSVSIVHSTSERANLQVLVKGYEQPLVPPTLSTPSANIDDVSRKNPENEAIAAIQVAAHLFKVLRGSNNLIFPNARREVERYTHLLNEICVQTGVPNEFWPHHGNLSKEIRAETELALKQSDRPATAVCTNTLELGIDIGAVKCVAQIGSAPSVASLRQRLGRSGRREGESAILRGYCIEGVVDSNSSLNSILRLETVEMVAMIQLLVEGWVEPPKTNSLHLSTLVQQILSVIAQNGGASVRRLYALLCAPGAPFSGLSTDEFTLLLRHLGEKKLITQDSSGALLHGPLGERLVNHYSFYAAFAADEEFSIVAAGKTLGTLPVSQMLVPKQRILFAGKTWEIENVDDDHKTIYVTKTSGGVPPMFAGAAGRTHARVREKMREILESNEVPTFLDAVARRFLQEGRAAYTQRNLATTSTLDQGHELIIFTWLGDDANEALSCLLRSRGVPAFLSGPAIEIQKQQRSSEEILSILADVTVGDAISLDILLADVSNLQTEKWSWALPDILLRKAYASCYLDMDRARTWAETLIKETQ